MATPTTPDRAKLLMDICALIYASLIYLGFSLAAVTLLELPYRTEGSSGILPIMLVAIAPFMLVFLSTVLHKLLPHENNLKYCLFLYVFCFVKSVNYIIPFKPFFETLPAVGWVVFGGPVAVLVLLLSEPIYHRIVKICCGDIGDYQSLHDELHHHFRITGHDIAELIYDIFAFLAAAFCLGAERNHEPSSDVESQKRVSNHWTNTADAIPEMEVLDSYYVTIPKSDNPYGTLDSM